MLLCWTYQWMLSSITYNMIHIFIKLIDLWFFSSVEFPAVLLDLSNGAIVDQFQQYVKPSQHKVLSDFCKQLTGITQVLMMYYYYTMILF